MQLLRVVCARCFLLLLVGVGESYGGKRWEHIYTLTDLGPKFGVRHQYDHRYVEIFSLLCEQTLTSGPEISSETNGMQHAVLQYLLILW